MRLTERKKRELTAIADVIGESMNELVQRTKVRHELKPRLPNSSRIEKKR
jgi:hypothetical protein